ncbi:serine hydrolase domain-containing protein [Aquisalibacillus elongatus]|uniref:CubicO group peptidase (Beta-lactamase class C family) n=1 Tax=Aquisalibacillus elongatus TaxID=485577 RepID=A0A3N5C6J2_9BACI|nr:serine hydrolase [Aquisalibacillus elongatus]RPF53915.1 CubicO group peptidase (beta-lactamase class C family) [Aquisalibacillus elongatus]
MSTNLKDLIESSFHKRVNRDSKLRNAHLLIHSAKNNLHLNLASGSAEYVHPEQPIFVASVGKLFTAVIIGQLVERGDLAFEDPITQYLDFNLIKGLQVHKGKDYGAEIQIKHLLNHSSGIRDSLLDPPKDGKPLIDLLIDEPHHMWSPEEIIEWSKKHTKEAKFLPGEGFNYSDTGYVLLGLIVEKATNKSFQDVLHKFIFEPLNMKNSYLLHYSSPAIESEHPLADFYIVDKNVKDFKSISFDYSAGGVVATKEDLLLFMKSLVEGKILRPDTLEAMKDYKKFTLGIDYGYGIMNFKTVPVFMPKKFNMWGNAGMTGSFMFYHPELDSYFIGSLNQFRYNRKGIMLVLKTINLMEKQRLQ